MYRRAQSRRETPLEHETEGELLSSLSKVASTAVAPDEALAARELVTHVEGVLEKHYPLGAALWKILMQEGDMLASKELAQRLGTTPAYIDTIKTRMRQVVAKHLSEIPVKLRPKSGGRLS